MSPFLKNYAPTTLALLDGDSSRSVTYRQLSEQISLFHSFFTMPKTLVFLFCSKSFEEAIAYLALMESEHVICLLDNSMHAAMKQRLIATYEPEVIVDQTLASYPSYISSQTSLQSLHIHKRADFCGSKAFHPALKLLLSTSGTTGSPKMIRLSRENLLSNAESIISYLQISPSERAIASLPFHYSYGLSVLNTHLLAGASIVTTAHSLMQKDFWHIMKQFSCTSFAGVPYMYHMLERIGFAGMELPDVKTMTQAGGRLDPALVNKYDALMKQRSGRFFVMYGQSEATARISYVPPGALPEKARSIGRPIPGGTLEIRDGERKIEEAFAEGELVYTGKNVMLGYAETREDLAKEDENKGILRTGDIGYFDKEGFFYLTGRTNRISKIYGLRINLDDVEAKAKEFGCPAAVIGDDSAIIVFLEKGPEALCTLCVEKLSQSYQLHPSTFICRSIEKLPLLSSGKIDYRSLGK